AQVLRRRFERTFQQLLAIEDLQHAALVGAVPDIDAIALRTARDRAVLLGRNRPLGAGLLANHAEVANVLRMRRIAQVIDLHHAARAPPRRARHEVGDAGVALPPVLVRVLQAFADLRDE